MMEQAGAVSPAKWRALTQRLFCFDEPFHSSLVQQCIFCSDSVVILNAFGCVGVAEHEVDSLAFTPFCDTISHMLGKLSSEMIQGSSLDASCAGCFPPFACVGVAEHDVDSLAFTPFCKTITHVLYE